MAIDPSLIARLMAFVDKNYRGEIRGRQQDLLEQAAEYDFDGDDEELWQALQHAVAGRAAPAATPKPGPAATAPAPTVAPWTACDDDLVTAPYRFVPLNAHVARIEDAQPLNAPADTLSAVIDVDWVVETPLLIGEGEGEGNTASPYRLGENWAIPGSTLRGMLRSIVETVSFARLSQINHHRRFALRDFNHPAYQQFIKTAQASMGAGWLSKGPDGKARITPCDWGYVEVDEIAGGLSRENWAKLDRKAKYDRLRMSWTGQGAFAATQPFGAAQAGDWDKTIYPVAKTGRAGVLVCSGPVPGGRTLSGGQPNKRFEYVLFERAGAQPVILDPASWTEFEDNNCKPSANRKVPDGAWKDFEPSYRGGAPVPVFFVGDLAGHKTDPGFSFGLTRLYRIPHKHSIGQVLLRQAAEHAWNGRMDFSEHLFGFVHETGKAGFTAPSDVSRRGRIAVGFATADRGAFRLWPEGPIETVMGTPKASYAPFYLSGDEKDWSSDQSRLAGRKRYLVRAVGQGGDFGQIAAALRAQGTGSQDPQKSKLRFITPTDAKTSRLAGRIRLTHVSRAELGAVLWAIGLGGDPKARHQIGRAKAFGAGQVRAAKATLHWRVNDAEGKATKVEWHPIEGPNAVSDFLTAFGTEIAGKVGLDPAGWQNSPQVQGILDAARPRAFDAEGTAYLPFGHPDFTDNRGNPRMAGAFAQLRKKTGIGAGKAKPRAPYTLLPTGGKK